MTRTIQIPTVPALVFVAGQMAGGEVPVNSPIVAGRDAGAADVVLTRTPRSPAGTRPSRRPAPG